MVQVGFLLLCRVFVPSFVLNLSISRTNFVLQTCRPKKFSSDFLARKGSLEFFVWQWPKPFFRGRKVNANFFCIEFSRTLRVMDVRAQNRGRPQQKAAFPPAPPMGRNFFYTEQTDAEGLGRKLLPTPTPPEKQTVGTVTASHKMLTLQALSSSFNAGTAKRGCLGKEGLWVTSGSLSPKTAPSIYTVSRFWKPDWASGRKGQDVRGKSGPKS